jgi:hypothetical protein
MFLTRQPPRFERVIRNEYLAFAHGDVFAGELSEPRRCVLGEPFAVGAIARRPLNEFRLRGLHGYIQLVMHGEKVTLFSQASQLKIGLVSPTMRFLCVTASYKLRDTHHLDSAAGFVFPGVRML